MTTAIRNLLILVGVVGYSLMAPSLPMAFAGVTAVVITAAAAERITLRVRQHTVRGGA